MTTSILWFRRDLRLHDNAALDWVCNNSTAVVPVYIHSAEEEKPWVPGGASRWWLHHSLTALEKKLADKGLKLHFFSGNSAEVISRIIDETSADSLVYNKLYEQHLYARDLRVEEKLKDRLEFVSFDSGLFFSPGTVLNNQQLPYRVFTPFYKKIRPLLSAGYSEYSAGSSNAKLKIVKSVALQSGQSLNLLNLLDEHNWHKKLGTHWQPGADNACQLLDTFLEDAITDYETGRDIPSAKQHHVYHLICILEK